MESPWESFAERLSMAFSKDEEELADILTKLPAWPPARVANLFLFKDDRITRKAILKAIEGQGVSSCFACTRLAGP